MKQKNDDKTIDWVDSLSPVSSEATNEVTNKSLDYSLPEIVLKKVKHLPYDVARCKGVHKLNIDSNEGELSSICIDCLRRTSKWSDVWQPVVMVSELVYDNICNLKLV